MSQLSQFVGELQHTEFRTSLQSVSPGSRKILCINPGEEQSRNNQLFCSYTLIQKVVLAVTLITIIFPICGFSSRVDWELLSCDLNVQGIFVNSCWTKWISIRGGEAWELSPHQSTLLELHKAKSNGQAGSKVALPTFLVLLTFTCLISHIVPLNLSNTSFSYQDFSSFPVNAMEINFWLHQCASAWTCPKKALKDNMVLTHIISW